MYSLVLRNRFTGTPLYSFLGLFLYTVSFLSVLCPTNFSCLSVSGLPSPFSQSHETTVLCQCFPSVSYRLESAPWGEIRLIVGPTLFLFSQGSPFCTAYCPLSENFCFIFFYFFVVQFSSCFHQKRKSVRVIPSWSEVETFLILLTINPTTSRRNQILSSVVSWK